MKSNQTKLRKSLNILFRVLIIILTWGYIAHQVLFNRDYEGLLMAMSATVHRSAPVIQYFLVLLLMLVNWGIESGKWQFMISKIEKVSFWKSFQAVLTGVSISSFTPNRIGEYFGRVYILDKAGHVEGILITILGSMSQLLITILAGTLAFILLVPRVLMAYFSPIGYLYYAIVILIIFLDILLLLTYFNVPVLGRIRDVLLKGKRMEKIRMFFDVFSKFSPVDLLRVIMLSLTRYLVFTVQYFLLLRIFSVPVPFFSAFILISLIFFIISLIPTVFMTELGVRDSTALFVFGLYISQTGIMTDEIRMGILAASTVLWIINLAFPALMGTFFVLRLKFFRRYPNTDDHA